MMVTVGITRVIISSQGHWCRYLYRPLTIRPWTRGGRQGSNRASLPLVSCHRRPPTRPPHPHTHPGTATPQLTMGLGRPSPRLRDLSGEKAEARALCGGRRGRGDGGRRLLTAPRKPYKPHNPQKPHNPSRSKGTGSANSYSALTQDALQNNPLTMIICYMGTNTIQIVICREYSAAIYDFPYESPIRSTLDVPSLPQ